MRICYIGCFNLQLLMFCSNPLKQKCSFQALVTCRAFFVLIEGGGVEACEEVLRNQNTLHMNGEQRKELIMQRQPLGTESFWKMMEGRGGLIRATVFLGGEDGSKIIRKSLNFSCSKNLPFSRPEKGLYQSVNFALLCFWD